MICDVHIKESWDEPQSFCNVCIIQNKEKFDFTKEPERFKKELNALFYHDVGDYHSLHPEEVQFVMTRWGIWNDQ